MAEILWKSSSYTLEIFPKFSAYFDHILTTYLYFDYLFRYSLWSKWVQTNFCIKVDLWKMAVPNNGKLTKTLKVTTCTQTSRIIRSAQFYTLTFFLNEIQNFQTQAASLETVN